MPKRSVVKRSTSRISAAVSAFISVSPGESPTRGPTSSSRRSHSPLARSRIPLLPTRKTPPLPPHLPPSADVQSETARPSSSALPLTSNPSHQCSTDSPHSPSRRSSPLPTPVNATSPPPPPSPPHTPKSLPGQTHVPRPPPPN